MKPAAEAVTSESPFTLPVEGSDEAVHGMMLAGDSPGVVFIHGFRSHCGGEKALALRDHASAHGFRYIRFDQRGRPPSDFSKFTISRALADCLRVIDMTSEPLVLVGSSLGALLALEAVRRREHRVAGLLLLAPAVEFVHRHFETLDPETLEDWRRQGQRRFPDHYDGGHYDLDYGFLVDARHYRDREPVALKCAVEILHGEHDEVLPAQDARDLAGRLRAPACRLEIVAGGDHRLNCAIDLICERVDHLRRTVPGG